ncbi:MAG: YraN family protein [Clostridia bacterium]|nr:YraN family protein [Clostridia bacterium]
MYKRHEIGRIGEDLATEFLENKGYEIIKKNFECKQGEIDIIAKDKNEYVFIEVKTRTNGYYGKPVDAVDKIKRKHIYKSTEYYVFKNNLENEFIRIDVIQIFIRKNKVYINHIKQAIQELN